jgi:ribonuclease P protein component
MHSFSFHAKEKLKSAKAISSLFESGNVIYSSPVRAIWQFVPENPEPSILVAFSVSKKLFKRAVDRNLLKRRMRESYRINKHLLLKSSDSIHQQIHLIYIYQKPIMLPYAEIEKGVMGVLLKLNEACK